MEDDILFVIGEAHGMDAAEIYSVTDKLLLCCALRRPNLPAVLPPTSACLARVSQGAATGGGAAWPHPPRDTPGVQNTRV